jgi:hypothetical protein
MEGFEGTGESGVSGRRGKRGEMMMFCCRFWTCIMMVDG